MKQEKAKYYILSHNDLDGVGATELARALHLDNLIDVGWSKNIGYSEIDDTLEDMLLMDDGNITDEVILLVVDLNMTHEQLRVLSEIGKRFKYVNVIDHHYKYVEDGSGFIVPPEVDEELFEITTEHHIYFRTEHCYLFWEDKPCGTSLLLDYFHEKAWQPDRKITRSYQHVVETIRLYDTWDWYNQEPKKMYAAYANELVGLGMVRELFANPEDISKACKIGEGVYKKNEKMAARFAISSQLADEFALCIAPYEIHNLVANHIRSMREESGQVQNLKLVILLDPSGDKVSLRSIDGTDVSEIAKTLGGGGHPAAAGFPIQYQNYNTQLDNISYVTHVVVPQIVTILRGVGSEEKKSESVSGVQ